MLNQPRRIEQGRTREREARKHEAQAERLQAQFAAAVADANAARSEVLHLREALVLQREDAASRARVQLAQAEFAAAERRKTEDERARASELADDLAGDSQVQLEPSRAGRALVVRGGDWQAAAAAAAWPGGIGEKHVSTTSSRRPRAVAGAGRGLGRRRGRHARPGVRAAGRRGRVERGQERVKSPAEPRGPEPARWTR